MARSYPISLKFRPGYNRVVIMNRPWLQLQICSVRPALLCSFLVMLFPQSLSFFVVLCPLLNLTVFLPLRVQSFVKRCNNCPLHKLFRDSLFVTSLVLLSSILIFFRSSLPFVNLCYTYIYSSSVVDFLLDHSFLAPEGKYPRGVRDAFIELVSSLFTGRV